MVAATRWEILDSNILLHLFEKVETPTLINGARYVCKSWYKASKQPQCWRNLDFQSAPRKQSSILTNMIKLAVCHSRGTVTKIVLPSSFELEDLTYILKECPALKSLTLPSLPLYSIPDYSFRHLFSKLQNLEALELGFAGHYFLEILAEMSVHGNKLVALGLHGYISHREVSAIIGLPEIKYLKLRRCIVPRGNLIMILKGCKELVLLDVRDCKGFDSADDEILKMASHIKTFMLQGSAM